MVEKIRELCKKQGTSITKLEQKLKFGNGVIGRWDKSKPSYDRLEKVANALGVPVSELTGEGQKNKPDSLGVELTDMQKEAMEFILSLSDEQLEQFVRVGRAMIGGEH